MPTRVTAVTDSTTGGVSCRQLLKHPKSKSPERPRIGWSPDSDVMGPWQVSPATRLRKPWADNDSEGDNTECRRKRARLTRKNLSKLDSIGKKKKVTNKTSTSAPDTASSTTKTISTTTSGFADQADKNGILNTRRSKRPENLDDLVDRLARSRETASPPESMYKRYVKATGKGNSSEMTILVEMSPLLKTYDDVDDGYSREFNRACTGLPRDLGFNNGLSAPQPDFIEGLEKREYRPFPISDQVREGVLYKDDPDSIALPHLAGEWKGPRKDMEEARLQSAYDGATLVYARNQALEFAEEPDPVGHAKVTTFTTDGTNLTFFAHYASPSDGGLEYHQYPIKSTNLKNSHQEYKEGYRQLRNLQDHAREQSHALKDKLKEYWNKQGEGMRPIAEAPLLLVPDGTLEETAPYEDESYEIVEQQQPCNTTPTASSELRKAPGSVSSSKSSPRSGSQKRKAALSSRGSPGGSSGYKSKYKSYWKKDAKGRYFHKHTDGTVSWLDDDDDDNDNDDDNNDVDG